MGEWRLNLIIVIAIVALMVAGIIAFVVWWHEGSQLPPGQDSMDPMDPGLVEPIAVRDQHFRRPVLGLAKTDCVKPPIGFRIKGVRCIIGGAPLDQPKPSILIAPTPKSAR
jgi:hypothetical protein